MLIKILNVSYLFFLLVNCMLCSSCSNEDKNDLGREGVLLKFELVNQNDKSQRIECEINNQTREITAHMFSGMNLTNFLMEFELGKGFESLYKSGAMVPSSEKLELRSQSMNQDITYSIKSINIDPFVYFRIYKDQDTVSLSIDYTTNELTAYFPTNLDVNTYRKDFKLGQGLESNLVSGGLMSPSDSVFYVRLGSTYQVPYKIRIAEPQSFDPLFANVYSCHSGFAYKPTNFIVDKVNKLVTANVAIGGNPYDKDTLFVDFSSRGKGFELLFGPNAAGSVLRKKIKILSVDAINKTVDFQVDYSSMYADRRWIYRYTFANTIDYVAPEYSNQSLFQFMPEFTYLLIGDKKYLIENYAYADMRAKAPRDLNFYQAKSEFYDLKKITLDGNSESGPFLAYIPFDADLSKARLEISLAKDLQATPDLGGIYVNQSSLSAMPSFDDPLYKSTGVLLRFENSDIGSDNDFRFSWNIKIVDID